MKSKRLPKTLIGICLVLVLALALPLTSACAPAEETPTPAAWEPPKALQWITCGTSSTGFISSSAMVGPLGEISGVEFRVLPGAQTMDRAVPLKDGSCPIGMVTATDTYTALEGALEFAEPGWGPQSWRNVYTGGPITQGIFTQGDSGIKTAADVKGRKYCSYPTYPSVHIYYMTAFLAYCNLTWDDIEPIEVGGYADGLNAVLSGKAELAFASATAPQVYELEASIHGLQWIPMPASETAAWDRFHEVNPFFYPHTDTNVAGASADNPAVIWAYDYGVRCYHWQDENLVYWATGLLWDNYDAYKDTHPFLVGWTHEHQLDIGAWFCPWHEGSVKY